MKSPLSRSLLTGITMISTIGTLSARLNDIRIIGGCASTDPCNAKAEYYTDDCTNDRFVIYTYCDCRTKMLDYAFQPKSITPELPWNFVWLIEQADWSTPGAPTGVYLIDSDGTHIPMINPYPGDIHNDDPDWKISKDLFSRYMDNKYPPGTGIDELVANTHTDLGVMGMLATTHSNLTIRQMPSPGNGMRLIVAPIATEIASPITITRADGTTVWSGGGTGESSTIDLSSQPSGMYFARGLGKSLVVQLLR